MRTAPAVDLTVSTASVWTWALRVLLAASVLAATAWAAARGDAVGASGAVLVGAYALWLGWHTRRPRRWQLAWDGRDWWLAIAVVGATTALGSGRRGEISVALDLGGALLLRFSSAESRQGGGPAKWWHRPVWLPLHRDGLPVHWHSLRCALYSPSLPPPPRACEGEA